MALGTMERLPNSHMMRDLKLSKDPNGILLADNINSDDNLSKVLHMTSGSGDNSYAHNSTGKDLFSRSFSLLFAN
jgi:hypothetical protein